MVQHMALVCKHCCHGRHHPVTIHLSIVQSRCSMNHCPTCAFAAVEPADPTTGMSAREKKMYELQQRLRQSRKANENAVIAEKRRQQVLSAFLTVLSKLALTIAPDRNITAASMLLVSVQHKLFEVLASSISPMAVAAHYVLQYTCNVPLLSRFSIHPSSHLSSMLQFAAFAFAVAPSNAEALLWVPSQPIIV